MPHKIKTIFFLLLRSFTTLVINLCQPIFEWEPGFEISTVKDEFNKSTPSFAQPLRQPMLLCNIPMSFLISE